MLKRENEAASLGKIEYFVAKRTSIPATKNRYRL
jgi:hypothetical protein